MPQPTSEFIITEALLDALRDFSPDKKIVDTTGPVDVKNMIGEINLFESIDKNYLTAQIAIMDDLGFIPQVVELRGTETLKLTVSGLEGKAENYDFTLELRVVSIVAQQKVNDRATVYNINCISKHAYTDAAAKLSRSYTGQLEDISEKILDDYLDVKVIRDKKYLEPKSESTQGRVKVIVPYISPLETVDWLLERATSEAGFPYHNWTTIWDQDENGTDNIRFGTLGTMIVNGIDEATDNEDRTFFRVYSAANRNPTAEGNRRVIVDLDYKSTDDTLRQINEGYSGTFISSLDTYTTQKIERHISVDEYREKVLPNVMKGDAHLKRLFDDDDRLSIRGETKLPSEFDARYRNLVTSYGTYEWETGYHDVFDRANLIRKVNKGTMRYLIDKNNFDITLVGYSFLKEELAAGDVIKLEIPTPNVDDAGADNERDERMSGYYLIQRLRHIFSGETHRVVCTVGKVSDAD